MTWRSCGSAWRLCQRHKGGLAGGGSRDARRRIFGYLAERSPAAAARLVESLILMDAMEVLRNSHPLSEIR